MSTDDKNEPKLDSDLEINEDQIIADPEELRDEAQEKKNELEELNQQYLRLAADFENYKKRMTKERADSIAYGNEELIKEMLDVLDNLDRALEHAEHQEDAKPLVEGVKIVQKQFLNTLEKFGVQAIDASKGSEFDPMMHQAIEHAESSEISPGHVLLEMLTGYTLKDRLLRPALVVVAKDSSKPETR